MVLSSMSKHLALTVLMALMTGASASTAHAAKPKTIDGNRPATEKLTLAEKMAQRCRIQMKEAVSTLSAQQEQTEEMILDQGEKTVTALVENFALMRTEAGRQELLAKLQSKVKVDIKFETEILNTKIVPTTGEQSEAARSLSKGVLALQSAIKAARRPGAGEGNISRLLRKAPLGIGEAYSLYRNGNETYEQGINKLDAQVQEEQKSATMVHDKYKAAIRSWTEYAEHYRIEADKLAVTRQALVELASRVDAGQFPIERKFIDQMIQVVGDAELINRSVGEVIAKNLERSVTVEQVIIEAKRIIMLETPADLVRMKMGVAHQTVIDSASELLRIQKLIRDQADENDLVFAKDLERVTDLVKELTDPASRAGIQAEIETHIGTARTAMNLIDSTRAATRDARILAAKKATAASMQRIQDARERNEISESVLPMKQLTEGRK